MHKQPSVLAKGVNKSFSQGGESLQVLKEISFQAFAGEMVLIVGPSGCGKTTLISIIAGTLKADCGTVFVNGHRYDQHSEKENALFRKGNVGFIFQQYHLIRTLSCLENVSIPLILNGWSSQEAETVAEQMLVRVGLKGKENISPKYLSGGQQQRVAIARALVHSPKLIVCDEPTAALDEKTGYQVMELLQEMQQLEQRTILIVTHDSRIFKYANRITKMNDGTIISSEDRPNVSSTHT